MIAGLTILIGRQVLLPCVLLASEPYGSSVDHRYRPGPLVGLVLTCNARRKYGHSQTAGRRVSDPGAFQSSTFILDPLSPISTLFAAPIPSQPTDTDRSQLAAVISGPLASSSTMDFGSISSGKSSSMRRKQSNVRRADVACSCAFPITHAPHRALSPHQSVSC